LHFVFYWTRISIGNNIKYIISLLSERDFYIYFLFKIQVKTHYYAHHDTFLNIWWQILVDTERLGRGRGKIKTGGGKRG